MYSAVGYIKRTGNVDFYFAVTVYKKEFKYYRARYNEITGKIVSFKQIFIKPDDIAKTDGNQKRDVGEDAIFAFFFKDYIYSGNKKEISIALIKLTRYNQLGYLVLYDIYYFLGDIEKIRFIISQYLRQWPSNILEESNFLFPSVVSIDKTLIPEIFMQIAALLEFRRDFVDYQHLFKSNNKDAVFFLNYMTNKIEVAPLFPWLINQSVSPFYQDLVVHFFIQSGLATDNIATHPGFKLQILHFIYPQQYIPEKISTQLLVNSQSRARHSYNISEQKHRIDKAIFNKLARSRKTGLHPLQAKILAAAIRKTKTEVL